MSIVSFGRYVPTSLREWDRVFAQLNRVIQQSDAGTTVTADNLPAQDAAYLTLSNNASLTNDRVLVPAEGQLTMSDNGPGGSVDLALDPAIVAALVLSGTGSPEGVVTANVGRLYVNTNGGAATTLYVKTSGTGNTGWTAK